MAILTVTTAVDRVDGDDDALSLREAVIRANATEAADTIQFASALEGRTLTLTQGQLTLNADLAIDGDRNGDGRRVALDGNDNDRVLLVGGGGGTDVALDDLVITGGHTRNAENGGGILVGAGNALSVTRCTVRDNATSLDAYDAGDGGGIFAESGAVLAVTGSTLSGNQGLDGGGIALAEGSALELTRSVLRENSASSFRQGNGGGIHALDSDVRISASTLADNSSNYDGGGIVASGSFVRLVNSTVAGNTALGVPSSAQGGGIVAGGGTLELVSSTVTGNSATSIYAYGPPGAGGILVSASTHFRIANSIVLGNLDDIYTGDPVRSDIVGIIDRTNGHNILGEGGDPGVGDRFALPEDVFAEVDPETGGGRVAFNGGPTLTVALRNGPDNLALSGGEPVLAGDVDQRGATRPQPDTSNPDIGAFELNQGTVSTTPTNGHDVLVGTGAVDTIGGAFGNDLILGQGRNDRLNGDEGGDTLRGGRGNDTLDGGEGLDTASYRDATGGVVVSLAAGTSSGALGSDTLVAIENLEGSSGADRLTGNGLANALGGRRGDDQLFGLTGGDQLFGGAGGDLLEPGFGNDGIDGGAGIDKISYFNDGGPLAVTIDLARGVATRSGETDRLTGVENADGTSNADVLRGDGVANVLDGAGGADRLFGREGDDTLAGALGNDRLTGGPGQDDQTGGVASDVFDYDQLRDSRPGAGRDVIADFAHLADDLDLSTIDARSATPVNDTFTFLATQGAAFTAAGQVRWFRSDGNTLVEANVDADPDADLQIELAGLKTLSEADFVL